MSRVFLTGTIANLVDVINLLITNAFRSEIPGAFLFIGIETKGEKITSNI
jgi:hypothetical protein